ncbi:MAG: SIR2 family protein [Bacteroidetes bacterium]|nr:SIR2 family protein [Bacteroidota bacterium]
MNATFSSGKNDPVEAVLNSLAYKLAVNWINASLPRNSGNEERYRVLNNKLPNNVSEHQAFRGERFIAIIGAGASKEAVGLYLAGEAAAEIEKKYLNLADDSEAGKAIRKQMKWELEHVRTVYKLDENDFETKLYYLSQLFDVHDDIIRHFGYRHAVSLNYELLAHMFRHRFLDVIINFNFDELLDESILQETGKDNFIRVISDGECPDNFNSLVEKRKLKRPIYIKPHGTFSHKSTLRFTREDYYEVPLQIQSFLRKLLSGTIIDTPTEDDTRREACEQVNLLILGFGMQSLELNRILSELYPQVKESHLRKTKLIIYYFDLQGNKTYEEKQTELCQKFNVPGANTTGTIEKDAIQAEEVYFIPIDPANSTQNIGGRLHLIYKKINEQFKEFYQPGPITRHELTDLIFKRSSPILPDSVELLIYFRDQILFNLALICTRNKEGLLGMGQIYNNRISLFYSRFQDLRRRLIHESDDGKIKGYMYPLEETLVDLMEKIGLEEYGYGRNVWKMKEWIEINKKILKRAEEKEPKVSISLDLLSQSLTRPKYYNAKHILFTNKLQKFDVFAETDRDKKKNRNKKNTKSPHVYSQRYAAMALRLINEVSPEVSSKLVNALSYFNLSIADYFYSHEIINNDPELKHRAKFSQAEYLTTSLAFRQRLASVILHASEWDYAFAITENGTMLIPHDKNLQQILLEKKFVIIQADYKHLSFSRFSKSEDEKTRKISQDADSLKLLKEAKHHIHYLPWWLHNEHMILFVKEKKRTISEVRKS